jgi:phosphonate transport system substrate-binding protein
LVVVLGGLVPAIGGSATDKPTEQQENLILAVYPYLPYQELMKRYTPLALYLETSLEIPVNVRVGGSYQEHIDAVGTGTVDIAILGPAPYLNLLDKFGPRPLLARMEAHGRPMHRGNIIVRQDSPYHSLTDIADQTMAFVDPASTMYLVPLAMLRQAGVGRQDARSLSFLGSHPNVALGVLAGDFEAGAIEEDVFHEFEAQGLRSIATTPHIPEHVFVTRDGMPLDLFHRIQEALLGLGANEPGLQVLQKIRPCATGISLARDQDYDDLRDLLTFLEMEP